VNNRCSRTKLGVFVGMFGRRKHIILVQNSFEYADGLCDLDYTAIPMGWIEDVQIIAPHYTPAAALRVLVASFVCCKEEQKKSLIVPIARRFKSGTTDLRVLAFSFDGKYSENAIYQKLLDLGLLKEEEDGAKKIALLLLPF
jgi:hypothetical protein